MTDQLFFKLPCQWCGTIVHEKIPTPAKDDGFIITCQRCQKTVLEFHWHEIDE